jgi:hypothetical protein
MVRHWRTGVGTVHLGRRQTVAGNRFSGEMPRPSDRGSLLASLLTGVSERFIEWVDSHLSMPEEELPDPDEYSWNFEKQDNVGIWFMDGWKGFPDEALEAASDHYRLRAGQDDITATLAVFGSETHLASDTQEYMGKEWSDNASKTGVEKLGFVSEGITAMAVRSNLDIEADSKSFNDMEEALEWVHE